ncbi:MAG: ABC transporter substrate-binding protein [Rhizobium leguminosarum]|nr:ABC transporter substrate-binding protein [Rhizobium leguminosarum]
MNGIFRNGINAAPLSRRSFIASAVAGSAALALSGRTAFAASGDTLKVGFISPRTGPLGGFGETDGYVLELARKALADGLQAGGKTWKVEILDQDTQSDPSRAGQLAKDLINNQAIDLMLAVSTPETINPVADACEAAGIPCLSTVMPWEAWYFGRGAKPGAPSPFKWTYHFGFGVEEFHKAYVSQWNLIETNKKVGVMYPNDADGNAIRTHLAPALAKEGFTIVDPGAYETGTTDFSAQIALFTKTGLFPSDIEALGDLGLNIGSAAYWHKAFPYKSTLTGVSGTELADGYETASGKQWTQQLGASLALLDAGFDALKASTDVKSKEAVAEAISALKTTTIAGKVDFTSGPVANVSPGPIIGTQWVKAPEGSKFALDYVVTENATDPNVPVGAKLTAYNG